MIVSAYWFGADIDWRPGHSVGNSLGRSLFVYTYGTLQAPPIPPHSPSSVHCGTKTLMVSWGPAGPNADGSDGNTPVGVIRSETFGCSHTQTDPCPHTVLGYDTIELFVTAEGTCATKLDGV